MPTKYTVLNSKIRYVNFLRHSMLQKLNKNSPMQWSQVPILTHIKLNPKCTQVDIANRLKLTPAAVAIATKKMESSGLIKKKINKNNLRCNNIVVTKLGKDMLNIGSETFDSVDTKMFEGFSDEDIKQLNEYMDKIIQNIKSDEKNSNIDINAMQWEFNSQKNNIRGDV